MKKEELIDAIGEANEEVVERVDRLRRAYRSKRKIWIPAACAAILAAAAVILIITNRSGGTFSKKDFVQADNTAARQYLEHSSMDEMDMKVFDPYFIHAMTGEETPYKETMILPADVVYYREEAGRKTEAFVLEKGTEVILDPYGLRYGGGFYTFPTFEKGWRYGMPFTVQGQEETKEYYYVKLSELETIAKAWIEYDECVRAEIKKSGLSTKKGAAAIVRGVDRLLYANGIYCSKD